MSDGVPPEGGAKMGDRLRQPGFLAYTNPESDTEAREDLLERVERRAKFCERHGQRSTARLLREVADYLAEK